MGLVYLLMAATAMAIFACIGYIWGFQRMLLMFLFLMIGIFVIGTLGETLVSYMNGAFMGVMLVLKGGLGDIASGDLAAAAAKLESITPPFGQGSEWLAQLIVLGSFILFGLTLVRPAVKVIVFFTGWGTSILARKESHRSIAGGALGLFYGYLVIGTASYLAPVLPKGLLPVPFLPSQPQAATTLPTTPSSPASSLQDVSDRLFQTLSQPGSIQLLSLTIAVGMALILVLSIRRALKKG